MKKVIFGSSLLLSGIIAFVGWCIAATQLVQPSARSSVLACLNSSDWIFLTIFAVMAIAGLIMAVIGLKKG